MIFTGILYSLFFKVQGFVSTTDGEGGPSFLSRTAAIIVFNFLHGYKKYGLF